MFFLKKLNLLKTILSFAFFLSRQQEQVGNRPVVYVNPADRRAAKYNLSLIVFFLITGHRVRLYPDFRLLSSLVPFRNILVQYGSTSVTLRRMEQEVVYVNEMGQRAGFSITHRYFNPPQGIIVPYPMSPAQYTPDLKIKLTQLRGSRRSIGIFFSGNQDENVYDNSIIEEKFGKVSRVQLLRHLKSNLPGNVLEVVESEFETKPEYLQKFVLSEWMWSTKNFRNASARVSDSEWLLRLSQCNFFLACPGMVMPMCHNIIEAMAVGAIPVTEYADEFYPPLEDGTNCITFKGKADATVKILRVLSFSIDEIERMRAGVIRYYENHLSPDSFVEKVRSPGQKSTLIMNAEQLSVL
jgi:hypothetical protein